MRGSMREGQQVKLVTLSLYNIKLQFRHEFYHVPRPNFLGLLRPSVARWKEVE
jgi:hypothetical protein